jgi:hypothetical protein
VVQQVTEATLPDFIRIKIPEKTKSGTALPEEKRWAWVAEFEKFFLDENGFNATGLEVEEDTKKGYSRTGVFDSVTGRLDFMLVAESITEVTTFCSQEQMDIFRMKGHELLFRMLIDLDQYSVAYESKAGLTILRLVLS